MKLVRFGDPGRESPGVLLNDNTILNARGMAFDIEDYNAHFFLTNGIERLKGLLQEKNLNLYSKVNGTTLQNSNTGHMIFNIPYIISFISQAITLEPGDIIATGTPGGIGSAKNPPIVLSAGDNVEVGVEGVGVQRCRVTT